MTGTMAIKKAGNLKTRPLVAKGEVFSVFDERFKYAMKAKDAEPACLLCYLADAQLLVSHLLITR